MRVIRFIRNTFISIGILLVLAVGGGAAYTWYMGQNGPVVAETTTPTEDVPVIKHVKPAPNAQVGASVQMLTSPVGQGANASITVKTSPEAQCSITVVYDKVASKDSGLKPRVADDFGVVSWTWTVEATAPIGKWPVTVTCAIEKRSAVVIADLLVEKL